MNAAVVAGLAALGAAGSAQAVHVNPDGLGQVLIFPYYTVRAGHDSLVSLINTTSDYKAVKVRFLEGKNSREVLDFNLFMSPQDVWTGAVINTSTGARLVSNDNSCVTPSDLFTEARTDGNGLALNAFKNYQYTGANADTSVYATLDRTREGYFEVIEMGVITDAKITSYIKHSAAGVPANCAALDALDPGSGNTTPLFPATPGPLILAPTGGLGGRASIINSANGANYTFAPTALDSWWAPAVPGPVPYSQSGNTNPSISTQVGIDTVSNVFYKGGALRASWATTKEAVSATIMRNQIINEFLRDVGTNSQTDWVVTFPTKRDFVPTGAAGAATAPFSNNFVTNTATGACDPFTLAVYNREEGTTGTPATVILPSPQPPAVSVVGASLCWEANIVTFGAASLLGSTNTASSQVDAFVTSATTTPGSLTTPAIRATQGPNGWFAMSFGSPVATTVQKITPLAVPAPTLNGAALAAGLTGIHYGLPVIGAMVHNYTRSGVVSTYGGVVPHNFTRDIR